MEVIEVTDSPDTVIVPLPTEEELRHFMNDVMQGIG